MFDGLITMKRASGLAIALGFACLSPSRADDNHLKIAAPEGHTCDYGNGRPYAQSW